MNLPLTVPCRCGGLNENCCYCNGWGYVEVEPESPLPRQSNKPVGNSKTKSVQNGVQCQICGLIISKKYIHRHMSVMHSADGYAQLESPQTDNPTKAVLSKPLDRRTQPVIANQQVSPNLTQLKPCRKIYGMCHVCGRLIVEGQLIKHAKCGKGTHLSSQMTTKLSLLLSEPIHQSKLKPPSIKAPRVPKKELVSCPVCGIQVRVDRIVAHIERVHEAVELELEVEVRSGMPIPQKKETTQSSGDVDERSINSIVLEQDQDASHDLYAYRDHGQLGSYPSHDGFDDESTP